MPIFYPLRYEEIRDSSKALYLSMTPEQRCKLTHTEGHLALETKLKEEILEKRFSLNFDRIILFNGHMVRFDLDNVTKLIYIVGSLNCWLARTIRKFLIKHQLQQVKYSSYLNNGNYELELSVTFALGGMADKKFLKCLEEDFEIDFDLETITPNRQVCSLGQDGMLMHYSKSQLGMVTLTFGTCDIG